MLWWMLQTSVVATALIVVVAAVCRLGRLRPAVQHALWLVVLLKLATPNVAQWPWSVGELSEQLGVHEGTVAGITDHDLETRSATVDRLARPVVSPTGARGRPAVDDVAGSPDPATTEGSTTAGSTTEASAAPSKELTDEERQLVQSVLVQGARPENFIGELQAIADVDQVSDAASADLRPRLAGQSTKWLAFLWLCGAAAYVARQTWQIVTFRRVLRAAHSAPAWLGHSVREMSAHLGVHPPRTLIAMGVSTPCLWCCGRALLLWPERLADDRQAERWRGVIVHELAHLRRRDHWVAWLELAVGCAWWWNPLYWLVRRKLRETADLACDAWAVWTLPDEQREFAESLLEVTRNTSRMPKAAPVLGATGGARRSYQRRIEMIMSQRTPCRLPTAGLIGAVLLGLAAAPAWSLDDEPVSTAPATAGDLGASTEGGTPAGTGDAPVSAPTGDPTAPVPASPGAVVVPDGGTVTLTQPGASAGSPPMTDAERIERLERQVQTLVHELRAIHGRHDARGGPATGMVWPGLGKRAQSAPAFSPDGKLIAVVTDDGRIAVLEAGTGKEVRRIDLGAPVSAEALMFNPQGSVLYVGSADGTISLFDVASGKKLSTTETQRSRPADNSLSRSPAYVPGSAAAPPPAPYAAVPPTDDSVLGTPPARSSLFTAADPASYPSGLAQSLAGAEIDLIRLSTEYVEAVGARKLAERHLSRLQGLDKAIAEEQVVTAEVNYETESNKVALLRAIAEAAAEATKGELEFAERMADKGYASPANVTQLKAKLRIIGLILDGGAQPPTGSLPTY